MSAIDPLTVPFLHSCERCRQKKRRCSGDKPACAWCRDHNIPCRYRRTLRFNKQLEQVCPASSIEALTIPVTLTNGSMPQTAGTPPAVSLTPQLPEGSFRPWGEPHAPSVAVSGTGVESGLLLADSGSLLADNGLLSADALAQLFSVDMVPQTNIPAADVLQLVNSYMTPFSGSAPETAPACAAMTNTEANVLANLGDMARQHASPREWMPVGFSDTQLNSAELHSQQLLDGESMFAVGADFAAPSGPAEPLPVANSLPPYVQSQMPRHSYFASPAGLEARLPTSGVKRPSNVHSLAAPGIYGNGAQPALLARSNTDSYAPNTGVGSVLSDSHSTSTHNSRNGTPNHRSGGNMPLDISEDDVPHILREYVSVIPGRPSAAAIYKIMRESFRAPRMGMVSLNMELMWFMLHKGVLPRIVFYGHISSTIRCSVANLDIKSMVPPHIDESCYELALGEVDAVKDCAALWGAIGLCMVTRYEFQSSRYAEMALHVDMALDIMHRIQFQGHSYPWNGVDPADRDSFDFQYMVAIYWKCFWWKLTSLLLTEQPDSLVNRLDRLPVYSSKTYDVYTADHPYDVDLMEMIPPNSWLGADASPPKIRFRGPNDAEFMAIRPPDSPCFGRASLSGAYLQQLLVVYATFFAQQNRARQGEIGLCELLRALWTFREHMHVWRASLPANMVLDNTLVAEYLAAIHPDSAATPQEIDLKASHLKDMITLLLAYHSFLVRANRFVMKMMLGEPLNVPPPDVSTLAFALRDLYDAKSAPQAVTDSLGYMNMYFHGCRIQAVKSANALCSIAQAAYSCKFNFYTLGSQIVFAMCDILAVYVSFLGNHDQNIAWRSKSRLSNVFNILRMLRHWAPALHMFVAGIRALSDPRFCLEEPRNYSAVCRDVIDPRMLDMSDSPVDSTHASDTEHDGALPPKRRRIVRLPQALESASDARSDIRTSTAPRGAAAPGVRRDETLSYRAADPIPEFPNPFPSNHVISLVIKDLGLSLAEFLAPAYPILLLKLMPTRDLYPDKSHMFGSIH
ncbi:hypothetical protein LPJ77_002308 [Coemansia sp. RSA 2523]|nr:hypothetical protein LPJ54_001808 [Coemansia sp. RSA 1824]KAJ1808484.1 hypothetical protein LPJ77_002308 [Coemansia sp. RSA 2523]KAJ2652982.1 hypothetical protein IW137_000083 [Coemansia sp. RSA 1287]